MSEKSVVEIYWTYGKQDGEELGERFIINDTPEDRKGIFDGIHYDDALDSKDDFIKGKIDSFTFEKYGGDWDEPTGGFIVVSTKSELIDGIKEKALREIEEIEKMFS